MSSPDTTGTLTLAAGLTDVGRHRKQNEDAILVLPERGLFVVADGMGGHNAGDMASQIATTTLAVYFETTSGSPVSDRLPSAHDDLDEEGRRLVAGVMRANREVFRCSRSARGREGMGSTVVAAYVTTAGAIHIAHVGDSRCYRISCGEIEQLTQDHSFVNDVRWHAPGVDDAMLQALPKNIVTRALGLEEHVEVEIRSELTLSGDIYVLCSDGLSGMISQDDILRIVQNCDNPELACEQLIAAANDAGGKDNISAVLFRIERPGEIAADDGDDDNDDEDTIRGVTVVCRTCGVVIFPGNSFCVECGAKVDS